MLGMVPNCQSLVTRTWSGESPSFTWRSAVEEQLPSSMCYSNFYALAWGLHSDFFSCRTCLLVTHLATGVDIYGYVKTSPPFRQDSLECWRLLWLICFTRRLIPQRCLISARTTPSIVDGANISSISKFQKEIFERSCPFTIHVNSSSMLDTMQQATKFDA